MLDKSIEIGTNYRNKATLYSNRKCWYLFLPKFWSLLPKFYLWKRLGKSLSMSVSTGSISPFLFIIFPKFSSNLTFHSNILTCTKQQLTCLIFHFCLNFWERSSISSAAYCLLRILCYFFQDEFYVLLRKQNSQLF